VNEHKRQADLGTWERCTYTATLTIRNNISIRT